MKFPKKLIKRQRLGGCEQLPSLEFYSKSPFPTRGILSYTIDEILAPHQGALGRIRQAIPQGGNEHYERYYLPLIRRYAAYVHLLPASQNHHHRQVGGMLSHGLEVAQHSLVLFCSSKFATNFDERATQETISLWALGCFFAGLGHDFAKIFTDMKIYNEDKNLTWNVFECPLSEWLRKHKIRNYQLKFLSGRHKKHEQSNIFMIFSTLLPEEIRKYWCSRGREVCDEIFYSICAENSIFNKCVFEADKISVREYLCSATKSPSPACNTGMAPHEHLNLAMNRLFSKGIWQINTPGGVAKLIDNHLYLVWPRAAQEMVTLLTDDYYPSIPRDPDAVAQILLEWGVVDEGAQETPYWLIDPDGTPLKAVRLVGTSRWLSLLQGTVAEYKISGEMDQQQLVAAKPVAQAQRTGSDSAVQNFLQILTSSEPPFPVQAVGQNLYTHKKYAEKWFSRNGVSRSQMLRLVRGGQLGLVKVNTRNGEEKMIGPPS